MRINIRQLLIILWPGVCGIVLGLYMKLVSIPAVADMWDRYFFIIGFIYLALLPLIINTVVEQPKEKEIK